MRTPRDRFWQSDSGEMYVDFLVQFLIATTIIVTLTGFFNLFMQHQNVVYIAKRLVRAIELSGQHDYNIFNLFNQLVGELKLSGANYTVYNASGGVVQRLGSNNRIQLRDTFIVQVEYKLDFRVFLPLSELYSIPFTLQARLPGMSEVFYRP